MEAAATLWTEPGAYSVAPGVYRVPLPLPLDGLQAVNVYVIEGDQGLTCIDGGWALVESRQLFESALKSIGAHPRDIKEFLVTHAHRDHYTQAITLREEFGCATVSLGFGDKGTIDLIHQGLDTQPLIERIRQAGAEELAVRWTHTLEKANPAIYQYPDIWLHQDTRLAVGDRTIDAIATPGHTAGHFVFADLDAGLLFAGDHVLPTITPSIGFESAPRPNRLQDFLESLEKVRRLPDLRLLPAHGGTHMRSHERVDQLLAHHDERLDVCQAAVDLRTCTAYEVAAELPWTSRQYKFGDLDDLNAGLAVLEIALHLDLLVARGSVRRSVDGDDVSRYVGATAPA